MVNFRLRYKLSGRIIVLALLTYVSVATAGTRQLPIKEIIKQTLDFSVRQSLRMVEVLHNKPNRLPRTIGINGELETANPAWWTSGFFPGELWYLYEYSRNPELKMRANEFTMRVKDQMYTTDNHDVGFMIFCSFGNAFRITGDPVYRNVIDTASQSLCTRFSPKVGCIRSWNTSSWHKWPYAVIIDNMMNLEMLMWASREFYNPHFRDVAITHANTTMKNHFRSDYSCFHLVSYDTISGNANVKQTVQGYSDESSWARGQGWALYGYTMMYRETKDPKFLVQARHIAHFILNHPRLPADKIPYWDFDAPDIPLAKRDASAGAIICSALTELSQYVDRRSAKEYRRVAEIQIRTLSSPAYLADAGENCNFVLKHSVGHLPANSEVDVPLTYADYYFIEAMMRYRRYFLE